MKKLTRGLVLLAIVLMTGCLITKNPKAEQSAPTSLEETAEYVEVASGKVIHLVGKNNELIHKTKTLKFHIPEEAKFQSNLRKNLNDRLFKVIKGMQLIIKDLKKENRRLEEILTTDTFKETH